MNFFDQWQEVPDTQVYDNGFKIQWEHFIRHVVEDAPYRWTLPEGAKGVQLVEAALRELEGAALGRRAGAGGLRRVMALTLKLPDRRRRARALHAARHRRRCAGARRGTPFNRIAYSAAHVVADPRAAVDPWLDCAIDWDATIAYRQRLWSLGLGVAEAMDTAQRGMGLDWPTSLELIRRSLDAAQRRARARWSPRGCGTDHLAPRRGDERRRRDPRLRRADGGDRGARRQADRDGQPRAGARGARARPTTSASTTAS